MVTFLISLFSAKPKKSTIPTRAMRGARMYDRPIAMASLHRR